MGIFKTEDCPICGTPTGALSKSSAKYNGLFVCQNCATKLSAVGIMSRGLKNHPIEELQGIVGISKQTEQEHLEEISSFKATKMVGSFVYFDEVNQKFAIPKISLSGKIKDLKVYNYSDILDFELIEDGNSISKGGALFGSVGALVVGSTGHKQKATCSKLQIKVTMNNMNAPTVYINFIESEIKKERLLYKLLYPQAQEALSLLNIIVQSRKTNIGSAVNAQDNLSAADEILKFKQLLDSGIISQEEFDAKKKQLLGL